MSHGRFNVIKCDAPPLHLLLDGSKGKRMGEEACLPCFILASLELMPLVWPMPCYYGESLWGSFTSL